VPNLPSNKLWELRWPEVDAIDRDSSLIILPTGAIEQHGHHLPLDTDIHNPTEIALRVAEESRTGSTGTVLVAPPVWWGTSPHHLAYPGTISLRMQTASDLIHDICASLLRNGFYRILILNGHGGNAGVMSATALRMSEELGISVAFASYWTLIQDTLRDIGDTPLGGMGHGCEMETSLQLHLRSERVAMDLARSDMPRLLTSYSSIDFRYPGPVVLPWDFVRDSVTGTMGDPTTATAEKGDAIAEAATSRVLQLVEELLALGERDLRTGSMAERKANLAQGATATAP
jgi:creatinine amidohydrolase